ncbi:high-affinity nickel-transport protein [Raineyella antarctica]|uniref:Nickel/cobalt efflux system n=1 Tax=Raineyella antarctica TaxID=1577474 RepID=A0A1G6HLV7_9ACTN|nr:HoxN/HupN/NixA family nickel/cobalt transporter [Raineyella antarctica]SDB95174.1 high-affinity nickel-transport protein [Raineyella antarctica]
MTTDTLPAASPPRGRWRRMRAVLTPAEWRSVLGMGSVILALTVIGWFVVLVLVAPHHYALGQGGTFSVGIGLTAYTLGMRHAFDADHIAAIDNTTRRFMADRNRPLSVGFWFSLGHSSVAFLLALLLAVGVTTLLGPVRDGGSVLHRYAGVIGTGVSGAFLYLIAAINIAVLWSIIGIFRRMRQGNLDEAALEEQLDKRGLMNRILGRATRSVGKPRHMFGVGFLFGLGFDTATEVVLLVMASTSAQAGLPWYAILALPVLFAAGMSLFDTLDGSFMNFAYAWAFADPVRKIYYNVVITGLSVAVALLIGTVELFGLLAQKLHLVGPFWDMVQGADINTLGGLVVGLFVVTWLVAIAVWKFGRFGKGRSVPTGPSL